MALPFRSMLKAVTMSALVPKPMVARQRLARQHVGAVELAVDHAVEQHLPVGLGFERDVEAFVFKVALFVGHHERRAVGQLDEAELQGFLFRAGRLGRQGGRAKRGGTGQGDGLGGETAAIQVANGRRHEELLVKEKRWPKQKRRPSSWPA
ncbi:MAG: hypothetical protein U5K55_08850 [Aliarcobacter sp.]|nr:hypothetical protein [Aliarcobacter sp.]